MAGEIETLRQLIYKIDKMSGKATPEVMRLLESRDKEGKTAFFAAVEHNQEEIADFLLECYP